ncbi:hypothetical protein B0H34DRAFT_479467 [Crassisporium funariophilum]|nr:hypothetical protein B0H34DRAFT_479467 [Crassisporium funariophilum]
MARNRATTTCFANGGWISTSCSIGWRETSTTTPRFKTRGAFPPPAPSDGSKPAPPPLVVKQGVDFHLSQLWMARKQSLHPLFCQRGVEFPPPAPSDGVKPLETSTTTPRFATGVDFDILHLWMVQNKLSPSPFVSTSCTLGWQKPVLPPPPSFAATLLCCRLLLLPPLLCCLFAATPVPSHPLFPATLCPLSQPLPVPCPPHSLSPSYPVPHIYLAMCRPRQLTCALCLRGCTGAPNRLEPVTNRSCN